MPGLPPNSAIQPMLWAFCANSVRKIVTNKATQSKINYQHDCAALRHLLCFPGDA
jgi:hypothetical protein